jgi:autotransporter-associated beta strand protein
VVQLGGPNQIADTSILRFDAGTVGNSGINNGNNAYFKLMGFNETVGGISDFTFSGVIENMENETVNTNAVLTLNTSGSSNYNGFLRNRAGGSGTGTLGLTVAGAGTQVLTGTNISYSGPTTINSGATLVLENISNNNANTNFNGFNSAVTNNGTLILRVSSGIAWNYVRAITGSGALVRDGGAGTLNVDAAYTIAGGFTIREGGTTNFNVASAIGGSGLTIKGVRNNTVVNVGATAPLTINSGGITVQGRGGSSFGGALLDVNSDVTVTGAAVNIVGGRLRLAANGTLLGTPTAINISGSGGFVNTVTGGGALPIEGLSLVNTTTFNVGDRIVNSASINLNGGSIGLYGSGAVAATETLGALNLLGGANMVEVDARNASGSAQLSFASINRAANGATVRFLDNAVGTKNKIVFTSAPTLTASIIGGWATVGSEFATYASGSVTALGSYSTSFTANTDVRPAVSPPAIAISVAINSLNLQGGPVLTTTINTGVTLTVNSGGILSSGGTHVIAGVGTGTLTAGAGSANDLIAHVNSGLTVNAIIANNGANAVSMVKSGVGTLTLGGINTYTGRTYLNEGVLQISSEQNLGADPGVATADQLFFNGGTLRTTANVTLDDSNRGISIGNDDGTIMVADGTTFTISAANAINATVGRLIYSGASVRGTLTIEGNNSLVGGFETLGGQNTAGTVNFTGDNTFGYFRMLGSTVNLTGNNTFTDNIFVSEGVLNIGGTNTFDGILTMEEGVLRLLSDTALVSSNGVRLVMAGGVFDLNDSTFRVSSLGGTSRIINDGSGTGTLLVNAAGNTTFGGNLQDGTTSGGILGLTKTGNGVLSLTSTLSTFSGVTTINAGSIAVQELDIGGFASSLGAASNAAANLVLDGGALRFNGSFATFTDRAFTLGTGANAGALIADGSRFNATLRMGFEGLSPEVAFVGSGSRTLTLGGSNRGDNLFDLVLGDGTDGATSVAKTGNGTWLMTRDNDYSGETTILAGILALTVDGALGKAGGAGVIIGGGTNTNNSLGNNNATLQLLGVNYQRIEQLYLAGGTLAATTNPITSASASTWAGSVFVTANSNILVGEGATLSLASQIGTVLGGAAPITQLGDGTLIFSGQADVTTRNTQSTAQHTVQAGTLRLDYSTNNNSKLSDAAQLILGGSRLGGVVELRGGSHVEIVGGMTLNAGSNRVVRLTDVPSTAVLRMNGIGRNVGATINFSADNIASTDTQNTVGILGAWATLGLSNWAAKSAFNEAGVNTGGTTGGDLLIRGYTDFTANATANDWDITTTTGNMNVTADNTQDNQVANTLRFFTPDGVDNVRTITLNGGNFLQGGAILVTPEMGSSVALISGTGTLSTGRVGTAINDLLILQNNTGAALEIAATIADNTVNRADRGGTTNSSVSPNLVRDINSADLAVGMLVTGTGIAPGTTISALSTVATVNVTLSNIGSTAVTVASVPANLFVGATLLGRRVTTIAGTSITLDGNANETIVSSAAREFQTNTITLSANANASNTGALQFNLDRTGTTTSGSAVVTGLNGTNGTAGLFVGMKVSGPGIAEGTTITAITTNSNITLSSAASTGAGSGNLSFYQVNGLDKSGAGNLILSGLNTYTGVTTLNSGSLTIDQLAISGITAGSNANLMTGRTTSGSTTVVVNSTVGLRVGQTVSGANLPGGATIVAITGPTSFTIGSAVGTGTVNTLTFGGSVNTVASSISTTTTAGSASITVDIPANYRVGQLVSGPGIAPGTTIAAISTTTSTITLSSAALTTGPQTLDFAGPASNLGAAANLAVNLVFNGGVLQYNGQNGVTDRGFTLNTDAVFDVGNAYTNLVMGGNFSTPTAQDNYTLQKTGAGLLELRGVATINSGSYGIEELRVDDGTLRLRATLDNQFARSDVGSLTLAGGTLELLQGSALFSTTQNLPGRMVVEAGASTIRVVSTDTNGLTPTTTTLALHDLYSPEQVLFKKGSTVLFSEQSVFGAGTANITLAGLFGTDVQVVMPRGVYQTSIDIRNPGVNYFAFVDFNGVAYNVIASDNISIGGAAAHTIQPNPADWTSPMNVMDGALAIDAFSGTTGPNAQVNTIRFFNNGSATIEGDLTDNSAIITNVDNLAGLSIGQAVQGTGIAPGAYIIEIDTLNNAIRLSSNVDIVNPVLTDATLFVDPLLSKTGTLTNLSAVISDVDVSGLVVGQGIRGTGIGVGTTITAIDAASATITLSQAVTTTTSGAALLIDDVARSTVTIGSLLTINGGAILQTTHAGKHVNSIVGGTLTSGLLNTDGATADLIIHNWNPLRPFEISSAIANNSAAGRSVNFLQTGDGTTVLSGANTYTGTTYLHGGVLRLDSAGALPTASNLILKGGVLGLNTGNFTRALGNGANQVQWAGSGGFAAYGTHRTVNIGGAGATLVWGSGSFVPDNDSLMLGAHDSNKLITFQNNIDLGRKTRMVEVASGTQQDSYFDSDAVLSGVLSGNGGSLVKAGYGILEITGINTYTGGTVLAEGGLMVTQGSVFASPTSTVAVSSAFGTGRIDVGTTTDTRSVGAALHLDFGSGSGIQTLANDITFGRGNHQGISWFSFANATNLTGVITSDRQVGSNVFLAPDEGETITVTPYTGTNGDQIGAGGYLTGSGGFTLIGEGNGGTLALNNANTTGQGFVIRNGMIQASNNNALGAAAIQLGDATFTLPTADFVTAGTTVLGVERTIAFSSDGRSALGGAFVPEGDGTFTAVGGFNTGAGGFYNISSLIGGYQFSASDVNKLILVKDEVASPERNGLYKITAFNPDGTMNLGRDASFDTAAEMRYGSQVNVTSGSAAGTYFMASPNVAVVNQTDTDPVYWLKDKSAAVVTLQIDSNVSSIANPINVVANGTGEMKIESLSQAVQFTGNVTLRNLNAGVEERKTLILDAKSTPTGNGMWFSGVISEEDGVVGATDDLLKVLIKGSSSGVVTLTGANTYSGGTDVDSGAYLAVNHATASATGTGDVDVLFGGTFGATDNGRAQIGGTLTVSGTLAGNGTIAPDSGKNILVNDGGSITVGAQGSGAAQSMTVNMSGGAFALNGMVNLDIFSRPDGNASTLEADQLKLTGTGSVSLGGFAELKIGSTIANTFQAGDSWRLIDWGMLTKQGPVGDFHFSGLNPTSYTGGYVTNDDISNNFLDLPTLGSGLFWDINNLYTTGAITVAVPEPGRLVLLLLGVLALFSRRRRRW